MELIRIGECKLKIMLTPSDMCHFELNAEHFGEDAEQTHKGFRMLMEEIQKKTGFHAETGNISVQYFPSKEGGCEMFVTNLHSDHPASNNREQDPLPAAANAVQLHESRKYSGHFLRECAYRFDTMEHLLRVCKRLYDMDYLCDSAAYRDEKSFYLFLITLAPSPFAAPEEIEFIVEYGSIENASLLKLYIKEHGKLICSPDAISTLAKLL